MATVESVPRPAPAERAAETPKVPRPNTLQLIESFDQLQLVRRWFTPGLFFLLFFCIAWDGFLVFWYSMAFGVGGGMPGPGKWLFVLFPIAHVAVGVGLTYFVIAGFLNRTVVTVTRESIQVRHFPVPWRGNKTVDLNEIDQVYCTMNVATTNQRGRSSQPGFCVNLLFKDGLSDKLVGMLSSADEARYIVRSIEDFYGWQHHPVAGEIR